MKPLIGVTAEAGDPPEEYLAALERCGAAARVLPNDAARVDVELDDLDGVLVTGGADVDPHWYREAPHAETKPASSERDAFEIALLRRARERDVPTFAICRGVQVANVAFGGTLIQHLPDVARGDVRHRVPKSRDVVAEHVVRAEDGTLLRAAAGRAAFATNSRHHQAIGAVAPDLRAVARTPDGIVEALEARFAARFWLGVQWHPESTLDHDGGPSRAIFEAFVAAAAPAATNTGGFPLYR